MGKSGLIAGEGDHPACTEAQRKEGGGHPRDRQAERLRGDGPALAQKGGGAPFIRAVSAAP